MYTGNTCNSFAASKLPKRITKERIACTCQSSHLYENADLAGPRLTQPTLCYTRAFTAAHTPLKRWHS
jgi:hypothetical protein